MTEEKFAAMLTLELRAKLCRIARGVLKDPTAAEDAVQTALLRIFRRLKEYRKITPSFLASRVVMVCGERRKVRAANASIEVPSGILEDPDDEHRGLREAERVEYDRTFGRRTPPAYHPTMD